MRRIGVVAALPGELAPLAAGWAVRDEVASGELSVDGEPVRIYAAAAGMGAEAATHGFGLVFSAAEVEGSRLDAVVSYGWAGAISCGVKPPDAHSIAEVVDTRTGERFATLNPAPGDDSLPLRLVTLDHVARPAEKRPLAERYQAVLVDMEAATIGRLARARSIGFYCVKGISDGYTDRLPDFNRFLGADSRMHWPAFALGTLTHPAWWTPLWKLGVQSRAAARNLAAALPACLHT